MFDSQYKLDDDLKKILYVFYDSDIYKEKTIENLINKDDNTINPKLFEIMLYGFRFCANIANNNTNNNSLYKSLLSNNYLDAINNSYIPGIDETENEFLASLDSIDNHMKNFPSNYGCYVCDCGHYYYIGPCGFPDFDFKYNCKKCGKPIGYPPELPYDENDTTHKMVNRKGHLRIFKDQGEKKKEMSKYHDNDENIPNIFYNEYKKKVIESAKNLSSFGFIAISRDYFEKRDKKLRKLSEIGYN